MHLNSRQFKERWRRPCRLWLLWPDSFNKLGPNSASKPAESVTTAQRNIATHIYDRQFVLALCGLSGFGSVFWIIYVCVCVCVSPSSLGNDILYNMCTVGVLLNDNKASLSLSLTVTSYLDR